ncbi:MAG: site-specific integrase [Prevotellaceae bacterium]|jgi:integrase|nr:site-specific integrase [Prevotellaceae bacterium]
MATVKAFIRTTAKGKDANIRFRYSDGRNIQLFHKSEIMVNPDTFDKKRECIKAKIVFNTGQRQKIDRLITERKDLIKNLCIGADRNTLTSEWLENSIYRILHPEKYTNEKQSFFDAFEECVSKRNISEARRRHFRVVIRVLKRYELYIREKQSDFILSFDTFTVDILHDVIDFLHREHEIYEVYPGLYQKVPESRIPEPRGQNTINGMLKKMRTFFIWAIDNGKTENNPFKKYTIEESVYGTPYYITIEERNQLYKTDLSHRPQLAVQRDIFVFQCLIGCRVADLYKLTGQNIINGAIEYIARKTKDGRPVTVRVPLNSIAKEILDKYSGHEGKTLLPYISEQKYNKAIKDAFTVAGLTRNVVILDPLTRESVIKPLNEIASSHLARRCFVGNLYRQVKDPNLVGALSGHREGSRAFARYREIDEGMKSELVKLLE